MNIFNPTDIDNDVLDKKNMKNSRVTNNKGNLSFGTIPKLNDNFPKGEIHLKLGDSGFYSHNHHEPKGAFGLRHIWDKHGDELNSQNAEDVVKFIESVLQVGAEVIIDPKKSPNKPLIVESNTGMVVVDLKEPQNEEPFYNIITAYDKKAHPGNVMGNLEL